ncbi:MAG: hypothetical protein HC888_01085 [Candidatus Competibacteraceae bacterium]|nr:hypothetical protein [Candidatus Competibacteraceae bacterium]
MLKDSSNKLTRSAAQVGRNVVAQASLDRYEQKNKKALNLAKERAAKMPEHTREQYLRKQAEKAIPWIEVTPAEELHIGVALLGIAAEVGICTIENVRESAKITSYEISYTTDALNALREQATLMAESKAFFWPMVAPPRNIEGYLSGGPYISKMANHSYRLVLGMNADRRSRRMHGMVAHGHASTKPLEALNAIQATPWKVNQEQLDLCRHLLIEEPDRCPKLKLPQGVELSEWKEFEDRSSPEAKAFYSQFFGERESLVAARSIEMLALTALDIAERFRNYPEIYFPHSMDSRGRLYPIVSGLSPQGNDFGQSLLLLANGQPLTEVGARHMAIEGANLFGVDKVSNDERELWALMNGDMIARVAKDPLDPEVLEWWKGASKPFLFSAWCREWNNYTLDKDYPVCFRIQRDGSNNGVQHHAALSRDGKAAATVNLMAADTPQDVYGDVAAGLRGALAVEELMAGEELDRIMAKAWLEYGITRTDTKRSVMTMPYGSSQHSRTDFIHDEVKVRMAGGKPIPEPIASSSMKACAWLSTRLTKAMEGSLQGPMRNMTWMKKVAAEHGGFMSWITPDGLPVQQDYSEVQAHRVKCHIGGSTVTLQRNEGTKKADSVKQKGGIAPNFIHSMDACHMRMYVMKAKDAGIRDFSMIHDSYGCHPNDGDTMQRLIREAFVDLYRDHDIAGLLHKLAPEVEPLEMGGLDIEQVLGAGYFFA